MSGTSWIFNVLKSHAKVDNFRFFLVSALKYPENYPPIVVSIARQFIEHDRISRKQLEVVCHIARDYGVQV